MRWRRNGTVLAKMGVSVGAWLPWGSALAPGKGEESVSKGARPGATNPITGLNHPAGKKRRRSLPTWRRGFIRAGAEPIQEAGP